MSWVLREGTPPKFEVVSVEANDANGEVRSIFRCPVVGGWLYQFVNERGQHRYESITFVPEVLETKKGMFKK